MASEGDSRSGGEIPRSKDDELPIVEWEVKELRASIAIHLRLALGIEPSILRVPRTVDQKIWQRHPRVIPIFENLSEALGQWEYVGTSRHSERTYEIMVRDAVGRFALIVIGFDRSESLNLVTIYYPRASSAENRKRQMIQREGKKED